MTLEGFSLGSLEGMMLKLKLQYFGRLMRRVDSLEKTLMLGGVGGRRRRERCTPCPPTHLPSCSWRLFISVYAVVNSSVESTCLDAIMDLARGMGCPAVC